MKIFLKFWKNAENTDRPRLNKSKNQMQVEVINFFLMLELDEVEKLTVPLDDIKYRPLF